MKTAGNNMDIIDEFISKQAEVEGIYASEHAARAIFKRDGLRYEVQVTCLEPVKERNIPLTYNDTPLESYMEMKEANCPTGKIQQAKHEELHDAVMHVNSVVNRLDELIERISGPQPMEDCEKTRENIPTLSEVLNASPGFLRGTVDDAHSRIDQIQSLLF